MITNKNIFFLFLIFDSLLLFNGCSSSKISSKNQDNSIYHFIEQRKDTLFKLDEETKSKIAQDHFLKGLNYYDNKDFPNAVLEFENALKYEKSSTIYVSLSEAYTELQDLYNALEAAMNAYLLDSTNTRAMELMFSLFAFKGDTIAAEKVISEIYSRNPSSENFNIYIEYITKTNPKKAIEIYEKYLQNNDDEDTKIQLAKLYFQLSDTTKSLEILYDVDKKNPTDGNNYDFIQIASSFSRFDYLKKFIIEIYPQLDFQQKNNVFLYFSEELTKFKKDLQENKEFVIKVLKDFKELDNKNIYALLNTAQVAFNLKDTNLTFYYSQKTLDLVDTIPQIPLLISHYFYTFGAKEEAFRVLNRFKEVFPEQLDYSLQLALLNFLEKKYEISRKYAEEVLHFNPEYVDAITMIADSYDKEGRLNEAENYYIKALQIDINNPGVNNNYAYFLSKFDDKLNEAERLSKIAIEAEPGNASFLDTYGWILYRKGDYNEAKKYLEKALELMGNDNAEMYEHLAYLYHKLGLNKQSIEYFKKTIELDPNNEKVKEDFLKLIKFEK
jgi:Tfp pilus assembly protein PilF